MLLGWLAWTGPVLADDSENQAFSMDSLKIRTVDGRQVASINLKDVLNLALDRSLLLKSSDKGQQDYLFRGPCPVKISFHPGRGIRCSVSGFRRPPGDQLPDRCHQDPAFSGLGGGE